MEGSKPRLPERNDTILASGARLKVVLKEDGSEVEIEGNRLGLKALEGQSVLGLLN
jgi:hypothetical protein